MRNTRISTKGNNPMKIIVLTNALIPLMLLSCNQHSNITNYSSPFIDENIDSVYSSDSSHINDRVESVVVDYWAQDAFVYVFNYSEGGMNITRTVNRIITDSTSTKYIPEKVINDRFISYIDDLFISGYERIEYGRTKREGPCITDYPLFQIAIEYDEGKSLSRTIQIGDEQYDIIYNPLFLDLIDFIDGLVRAFDDL